MPQMTKSRIERRVARRGGDVGRRIEYLAFVLAGDSFAVQIAHVAEILKPPPITEVPRAPRNVLGVISVRGKLVTVLDLRRRFHLVESSFDRRTRVLLADAGMGEPMGLLVDEVLQVWRLAPGEIEPAHVLGGDQPAHIAGVGRPADAPGSTFILLDLRPIVGSA